MENDTSDQDLVDFLIDLDIQYQAGTATERTDLCSDLRGAVDGTIDEGETLAKFRKRFDAIVDRHGWSCNGDHDWFTHVIYDTSLRTSYAAERYEQMQGVKELRPYWRYRHSHASEEPRAQHLEWDGLVLDADDPWWDAHYPPNGWGCMCYVETLSERELKELGKTGPDKAPAVTEREVTVGTRSPNPRTVSVPEGIDPGFAYAPGLESPDPDLIDLLIDLVVQYHGSSTTERADLWARFRQ